MIITTLILTLLFSSHQAEKFEKQKPDVQVVASTSQAVMAIDEEVGDFAVGLEVFVELNARKPNGAFSNAKEYPVGFT
jgi:hypothetical protein